MGQKPNMDIYELNPDHTHFIMVEDEGKDSQINNTRFAIERQLQKKYGPSKRIRLMSIGVCVAGLYEPRCEKTGLQVSDQVRHKPGCAATEDD